MKRISKSFLSIILGIVVIVSIILSAILWSNPSYEHTNQSNDGNTQPVSTNNRSMSDVYRPTQAIQTTSTGKQYMLINQSVNIISEIKQQMQNYHNVSMKEINSGSKMNYEKFLKQKNSIMLSYSGDVTTKILNSFVNNRFKNLSNQKLNRIILSNNDQNHIYLLHDDGYHVYQVSVANHNLNDLNKLLIRNNDNKQNTITNNLRKIPVKMNMIQNRPILYYLKSISMPQYGYLINRGSKNSLLLRLLGDTQHINRTKREGKTSYNDQSSRELEFNKYNDVSYTNYRPDNIATNYNQFLNDAYKDISKMDLPLDNIRYFNSDGNNITYRAFVESFPIFNQTQFGAIHISNVDNDSLQYNFSLNSLQIPVPNGRHDRKLPPTDQVVNTLKAFNYDMNKVQDIQLGYHWEGAKSSNLLVNLVPTWFIKYNNQWISYDNILTNRGGI